MNTYEAEIGHDISCYGNHTFEAASDAAAIAFAQFELDHWEADLFSRFEAEPTDPQFDTPWNRRVLWVRRVNPAAADSAEGAIEVCGELTPTASRDQELPAKVVAALEQSRRLVDVLLRVERKIAMADLELLRRLPEVMAAANLMPLQELSELLASALEHRPSTNV